MKKKNILIHIFITAFCTIALLSCFLTGAAYLISGGYMNAEYLKPWNKNYSDSFTDPRISLTAIGLLAPNNHNMQPWKIKLDPNDPMVFYLYADSSRLTKEVDPDARQIMISQGTFLQYVSVAGEEKGWHVNITLFPDGEYQEDHLREEMNKKPVARLSLVKTAPKKTDLYQGVFLPDTNRNAYISAPLAQSALTELNKISAPYKEILSLKTYQKQTDLKQIGTFAVKSAEVEAGTERVMDESNRIFRANETAKNKYRYGYSVEGQGISGMKKLFVQSLVTLFPSMNSGKDASQNFINYTKQSVDHTSAYILIFSANNSRTAQVMSGMLYSDLVLTGHTLQLAVQPLSQVLEEYPEMHTLYSEFYQKYASNGTTIQMLVRIGQPEKSTPLSMRRDVLDLMIK